MRRPDDMASPGEPTTESTSTESTSTVGAFEAKTRLSELLERVARGETITITKHGKPVAKLVPASLASNTRDARQVVEEFIAYSTRQARSLGGMTVREMVEEGRRF